MIIVSVWVCLANKFTVKFICYKFFKNFNYNNPKNFSKYLNYIFQNIQKFTHFKNFPITSTVNYNKILNKYLKNSFTKRGLCIYTMS